MKQSFKRLNIPMLVEPFECALKPLHLLSS